MDACIHMPHLLNLMLRTLYHHIYTQKVPIHRHDSVLTWSHIFGFGDSISIFRRKVAAFAAYLPMIIILVVIMVVIMMTMNERMMLIINRMMMMMKNKIIIIINKMIMIITINRMIMILQLLYLTTTNHFSY